MPKTVFLVLNTSLKPIAKQGMQYLRRRATAVKCQAGVSKEFQPGFQINFCPVVLHRGNGFIFKNAIGDVLCEQNINFAIRRITETYNIQEEVSAAKERREPVLLPHFSCHILRHTFATRLCENETNLKSIQD